MSSDRRPARSGLRSWLVIGPVVVAVVVGAGIAVGYRLGNAGPVLPPSQGSETAQLEQQMAMLRAQLRALERRAGQSASARVGEGEAPPPSKAAGAPSQPASKPADENDQRAYFADLEARFGGEPRDPVWAAATEEKLRHTADNLGPGLRVDTARCGQGSCRLELQRDPAQVPPLAFTRYVQSVAAILPEIVAHYPDDRRVVLYLQREGGAGFPPLVGKAESPTE